MAQKKSAGQLAAEKAQKAHREHQAKLLADKEQAKKEAAIKRKEDTVIYRKEITAYLSGDKDFAEGYALLLKYCSNRGLLQNIQLRGERLKAKMIWQLEQYSKQEFIALSRFQHAQRRPMGQTRQINVELKEQAAAKEAVNVELRKKGGSKFDPSTLPEALQPYYVRACKYYREMNFHHVRIGLLDTDEKRAAELKLLKAVENDNKACWSTIDAYLKDGTLPKAPAAPKAETTGNAAKDSAKAISSAKSYLTKNVKKLATLTGEKLEAKKADIKLRVDILIAADSVPKTHEKALKKHGLI